jgi:hypothetical protein
MKVNNPAYLNFALLFFLLFTLGWSFGRMLPVSNQFKHASRGMQMLDLNPQWNEVQVQTYLQDAGTEARHILASIYKKEDFIFPLAYGPLLMLALMWLCRQLGYFTKKIWLCTLLPLAMMGFDYWENFSILSLLQAYPQPAPAGEYLYIITLTKWGLGGICGMILITLLGIFLYKKYRLGKR